VRELTHRQLFKNSRFYIVTGSVLLSLIIFFLLNITIVDNRVRGIRLQEIYGLGAVLYWYVVLLISATAKVITKKAWMAKLLFMRRAIGAMVTYFVALHVLIATSQQLDGWHGVWLLPAIFRFSLILGSFAALVLLIMAALSIDKIVAMTRFKYWRFVSRISYLAGIAAVLHIWLIGSHVASAVLQLVAFQALILLFSIEAWRLYIQLKKHLYTTFKAAVITSLVWLLLVTSLIGMRLMLKSQSQEHANHASSSVPGSELHAH
jgi:DMSO/TMAO reductase YedYZ heme-binding membrane subunit